MKTFNIKRILIPIDFSETSLLALEHGAYMAQLFKADLYLLHIIEILDAYSIYEPALIVNTADIEELAKTNLNEKVEMTYKKYGIQAVPIVSKGWVVSETIDVTQQNQIDIIVMGTHGVKGFTEYFIGSNAHKIASISPCPVITIQTNTNNIGFSNIIMPIDNTSHSRQKVDLVIKLASQYRAKVHILGLINSNEKIDENKLNIKIDAVEKAIKKSNIEYIRKTTKGENLAIETMNYAEEVNADLITIMTDHESNLTGMFLGAFAKQIINHSRIPIMSIKPTDGNYEAIDLNGASNPFND